MIIRSIAALAALAAAAPLAGAQPMDIGDTSFVERDPADLAIRGNCVGAPRDVRERTWLYDDVFEDRFAYADIVGRNRAILVEYERSCDQLTQREPVPQDLCRAAVLRTGGEQCFVREIYEVADERAARWVALRRLIDEARADGRILPRDNVAAAEQLVADSD